MLWLETLWHGLLSWATIYFLIGIAATLVAIFLPPWIAMFVPNLRITAVLMAIVAFFFTTVANTNYHAGLSDKQAQWDAAREQAQAEAKGKNNAADLARQRVDDCYASGGLPNTIDGTCTRGR